jgi:hypothetical protein
VQFAGQLLQRRRRPECQAIRGILGQITEFERGLFAMEVKTAAHNAQSISAVRGAPALHSSYQSYQAILNQAVLVKD